MKIMQENTSYATIHNTNYIVTLEECDGELYLPIPDDVLNHLGWQEGDDIEWHYHDHSIILRKVLKFDD